MGSGLNQLAEQMALLNQRLVPWGLSPSKARTQGFNEQPELVGATQCARVYGAQPKGGQLVITKHQFEATTQDAAGCHQRWNSNNPCVLQCVFIQQMNAVRQHHRLQFQGDLFVISVEGPFVP